MNYLEYNGKPISIEEFNKLANIDEYVNSKSSWSAGRKAKIKEAFYYLLNKSDLRATREGDNGNLTYDGSDEEIPLKQRENYNRAASYIIDVMSQTPTIEALNLKKAEQAELERLKLPVYENFSTPFVLFVTNDIFGGRKDWTREEWNKLDGLRVNGLYQSSDARRAKLIDLLTRYRDTLKPNAYRFDGSPFTDYNDLYNRITSAINTLSNTDRSRDEEVLNRLGLIHYNWLGNGGDDLYGQDAEGNQISYSQYYALLNAQRESLKEALKPQITPLSFKIFQNSALNGTDPSILARDVPNLLETLNKYSQTNFDLLTGLQQSHVIGAYKYLKTRPVSDAVYNILVKQPTWQGNTDKNRFRVLEAYDDNQPYIWDSKENKIIQISTPTPLPTQYSGNPYEGILTPEELRALQTSIYNADLAELMNTEIIKAGLTPELSREMLALALDLGAFLDPEAITGTSLALGAAYLREQNRPKTTSGLPSWESMLDWGTAALGGLPVLGDLLSVGKPLYRLRNLVRTSTTLLARLAEAATLYGVYNARESYLKLITNPLSLTPLDVQNITYSIMGLAGGYKTIRANKAGKNYDQFLEGATREALVVSFKSNKGKVDIELNSEEAKEVANLYKKAKTNSEGENAVIEYLISKGKNISRDSKLLGGEGFIKGSKVGRKVTSTKSPVKTKRVADPNMLFPEPPNHWLASPLNRVRRGWLDMAHRDWISPRFKNRVSGVYDKYFGNAELVPIPRSNATTPQAGTQRVQTPPNDDIPLAVVRTETPTTTSSSSSSNKPKLKEHFSVDLVKRSALRASARAPLGRLQPRKGTKTVTLSNGKQATFKVSSKKNGKVRFKLSTPDENIVKGATIQVDNLRSYMSRQLLQLEQNPVKRLVIRRLLKPLGWMQQGGRINLKLN